MAWDHVASRTSWQNMQLSIDYVAELLRVKPQSIRQYLAVGGAEGFPAPDNKIDGKNYWRPSTIYDFIDSSRPHLRGRIPRLYPLRSSFRGEPAAFLGAEHFQAGRGAFGFHGVLHYWQPADDRGRVIVAYPDQAWGIDVAHDLAAQIADQRPDISTVVVPTHTESRTPDPQYPDRSDPRQHLGLGICETKPSQDDRLTGWREQFSWSDLAFLFRIDVPYWPIGLLDMEAIAAWQPGQVRKITPRYRPELQIKYLASALADSCKNDSELFWLLGRACRVITYAAARTLQLIPQSAIAQVSQTGLLLAATSDIDDAPPPPLTEDEIATLLHLSADPRYAESAFRIGAIGGADLGYSGIWKPVLTSVTTVDREQLGPLAQRWRERLRPLPDPRLGDQLGFTRIYSRIAEGPDSGSPSQCLYDPEEPDCWIVETSTRIYATSGARLRHAVGHLQAIEIGLWQGEYQVHYNVFAADQNGTPWIMPEPNGEPYSLGYDGSSPRALSIAISELCSDINAMLSGNDQFNFIGDQEEPCGLRDKLIALKSPLTLHRCDIDRLLAPATTAEPVVR